MKKNKLEKLTLQSFTTQLENKEIQTIAGGGSDFICQLIPSVEPIQKTIASFQQGAACDLLTPLIRPNDQPGVLPICTAQLAGSCNPKPHQTNNL